jgi:hypothetical protein
VLRNWENRGKKGGVEVNVCMDMYWIFGNTGPKVIGV